MVLSSAPVTTLDQRLADRVQPDSRVDAMNQDTADNSTDVTDQAVKNCAVKASSDPDPPPCQYVGSDPAPTNSMPDQVYYFVVFHVRVFT